MRRRKLSKSQATPEFDKTDFVDKELVDKFTLWMLRVLLKCGGHREFIDKNNYFNNFEVVYFLDIGKFAMKDAEDYTKNEVLDILKTKFISLEKRKNFTSSKLLIKNIKQLSKLMNLNTYEEQILEFSILSRQFDILDTTLDYLGRELNTNQFKRVLSTILDIPYIDIANAFASDSKFSKSLLLTIDKDNKNCVTRKLEFLSDTLIDNLMNSDEDIFTMLQDSIRLCDKATLKLKDFIHVQKDIDILLPYLSNAITTKQKGVNILLYGLPGTGKTELTKTIAQSLKTRLFEVSYSDIEDEPIDGKDRLKAYKTAQALLLDQNSILMYDEAEDIFESSGGGFFAPPSRQKDKAWINRVLENNSIPTIWITNNINSIDDAIVRRFDMAIEMPIPKKSRRIEILKNNSNNILDARTIQMLAGNENIAPALITRATKVISNIETIDRVKAFTHIINNALKAQGYKEIKEHANSDALPNYYNPKYINTTVDLKTLTKGIQKSMNARLCLYGPAGTGKSAFGRYISETLDKPLLLKKGSDLISKWVGETEQNIANAFEEAQEEKAVLVFDEVDSFLADRAGANQNWEVTQVNEMLVQMENFNGIFIATTNLMDNLDRASLRRFDLKLEFDYLESQQAYAMFLAYIKELKLKKPSSILQKKVESLRYLTPGDFAAVVRQNRFRPIADTKDFLLRLEDEINVKNTIGGNLVGFCHG